MTNVEYNWINLDICIAESHSYETVLQDILSLKENDINMLVSVYNHRFSIITKNEDSDSIRHYMFALENYPEISEWELSQLINMVVYESSHERKLAFWFGDKQTEKAFVEAINHPQEYSFISPPDCINVCRACVQGCCKTEYVCHTSSIENLKSIFESGKIFSYAKLNSLTLSQMANVPLNYAGDPPDYFQYVMFTWGNCFMGDRAITERKLGRLIYEEDIKKYYSPTIKFYFKYDELINLSNAVFDGYHPVKIKDSISLYQDFLKCAIPAEYKESMKGLIPKELKDNIVYVDKEICENMWEWADRSFKTTL